MRLTSSSALPNLYSSALGIPCPALGAQRPVDVCLPDEGSVTDETRHYRQEDALNKKRVRAMV